MKQVKYEQDERQKLIGHKSLAVTCIFLMICMSVAMIYDLATTGEMGWEFWGLIGACGVMGVARHQLGDVETPKGLNDRPLPLGNTKEEKGVRCKSYAIQSAIFGLACAVFDILLMLFGENDFVDYELTEIVFPSLGKAATVAVTAAMAFVIAFVISYIVDYFLGEYRVKKYNKMLKELDDDE